MGGFISLSAVNGYQILPSGIIIQWGQTPTGTTTPVVITYPIPFPRNTLNISGTIYDDINPDKTTLRRKSLSGHNNVGTSFFLNNATMATSICWLAIGY